jgi:hypothetical protein
VADGNTSQWIEQRAVFSLLENRRVENDNRNQHDVCGLIIA